MRCKSITLILSVVVITFCASAKEIYQNETLLARVASRKDQSVVATSFVLVNPRQIQRAEITIGRFLARLTGPIVRPITLKLSFPNEDTLQGTIREICEAVRAKIAELARNCGLITSVHQSEQISTLGMSEDWFSEGLVQGSLLLRDLVMVGDEVWTAIDRYLDVHNVTLQENRELFSRSATIRKFTFLSSVNGAAGFNERLFKCLHSIGNRSERASSFDLNRALANLARAPPDRAVKAFKTKLDRAFFRYAPINDTSELYVPLCHTLVERACHYGDCVAKLRRLETCVSSAKHDSSETIVDRAFPIEPWLTAIENLSGCKIRIDADGSSSAIVRCDLVEIAPRTTARQVKFIYERILDRRISRRSPLHHAASELGNALSTSRWGRRFAHDVYQYFAIYHEGRRRLNELSKNTARNKKAAARYRKIYKSLNLYKNGVLRKTLLTISNVHRSVLEAQKFLVHGIRISFKESWQNYINILACVSDWMAKFLELLGCANLNDTDIDVPISTDIPSDSISASDELYDRDNNQIKYIVTYRKHHMRKKTDKAFEKLLQLMNRVSRMRSRNDRGTLACLANNLLLVAMFMESISFISTMFCLANHENKSNSEELQEKSHLDAIINRCFQ